MKTFAALFLGLLPLAGCAQSPTTQSAGASPAEELLARSVAYHDPNGFWGQRPLKVVWVGKYPDGREETRRLWIDSAAGAFTYESERDGNLIRIEVRGEDYRATVNGSEEISDAHCEKYRLDDAGLRRWRNYYEYLAGLPMKLQDAGTRLEGEPFETDFQGKTVLAQRVTYDAEVGSDTWHFYFDPESARLVGCRFDHDEAGNDGEYMVFEGEIESQGMRLPRVRSWYVNRDDKFLGTDTLQSVEVGAGK